MSIHSNNYRHTLSFSGAVQYVPVYLCGVWSDSGRLPDRVQISSPSGCGWLCTGPLETHTPAAALSSRSTPSCPHLRLYILHVDGASEPQRHIE